MKIKRLSKDINKAYNQFLKYETGFVNFSEYLYCRFKTLRECEKHFNLKMSSFDDWYLL